jgi:hypothetical protein
VLSTSSSTQDVRPLHQQAVHVFGPWKTSLYSRKHAGKEDTRQASLAPKAWLPHFCPRGYLSALVNPSLISEYSLIPPLFRISNLQRCLIPNIPLARPPFFNIIIVSFAGVAITVGRLQTDWFCHVLLPPMPPNIAQASIVAV